MKQGEGVPDPLSGNKFNSYKPNDTIYTGERTRKQQYNKLTESAHQRGHLPQFDQLQQVQTPQQPVILDQSSAYQPKVYQGQSDVPPNQTRAPRNRSNSPYQNEERPQMREHRPPVSLDPQAAGYQVNAGSNFQPQIYPTKHPDRLMAQQLRDQSEIGLRGSQT